MYWQYARMSPTSALFRSAVANSRYTALDSGGTCLLMVPSEPGIHVCAWS
jgi:hypothetical protein